MQFSVRDTCPVFQNPSLATGPMVMDVHMSNMSATAPPCSIPVALHSSGFASNEKTVVARLGSVGERETVSRVRDEATDLSCHYNMIHKLAR